jgi:L-alanine-DL-glutamate epimerase-like enolase superfamily enzyme
MQLNLHRFDLPLKHEFTISRGSMRVQPTLIVELEEDGHHGFGEATTNSYYRVTLESMSAALDTIRPLLADVSWNEPADLWSQVAPHLVAQSFALCAFDQAAHDLWGKKRGAPVYRLWELNPAAAPLSNYTIGIDTIDVMVAKLREVPDWPIYKIKLGTEHDLRIIRELRGHTEATFRVDANCGWTVDETLRNAEEFLDLGVEFIEQPLPASDWDGSRRLFEQSPLPIVADESCIVEADVDRCRNHFHGVNIKLVKCGGMTPARRMIDRARELDLKTMVGCMTESTVGISAIAQLAPLLDYVDMDGAALLDADIATGVRVDRGVCRFPDANGNGVQLFESIEI